MNTVLFDGLCNEGNFLDAYIVIKNKFNKNCGDVNIFRTFFDLGLRLASLDITFDERKNYLNEVSNALAVFSDNVEMNVETLGLIKESGEKIGLVYGEIVEDEAIYASKKYDEIADVNSDILRKLAEENEHLKSVGSQKEFDEKLADITKLEASLRKDCFTDSQQSTYDVLTKYYSDTISRKMEELNNIELIELNKKAVHSFKQVFDSFVTQKSKYKDSESNLKALVMSSLFTYDSRQLFNETLIYYNHIYSMIFNEVSDHLKYKLTEWSIATTKIKK